MATFEFVFKEVLSNIFRKYKLVFLAELILLLSAGIFLFPLYNPFLLSSALFVACTLFVFLLVWMRILMDKQNIWQPIWLEKLPKLKLDFIFPAITVAFLLFVFLKQFKEDNFEAFGLSFILFLVSTIAYYWIEISEHNRDYLGIKSDLRDSDHINTLTQKQNLQDMISPHFLFNSLNTLTSIVTESKGMAIRFTSELAYLYDFILKNKGEGVILVDEELNLIQRYVYLLESRYEKALMVDLNIPKAYTNCWIPPLSIQNLIENAVKHNGASKKRPLKIEVFCEDELIVVRNNVIPKKTPPANSTGIGINYVRTQFRKIAQKEIRIEQDQHNFIVYLPLIYPTDLIREEK